MGKARRNRLRVLRAERRISQLDLASKTGISTTRIWKIENGYADATPTDRARLARFFRVPVTDVFPSDANERASA
jgi:putative transcriptional regulator